MAFNDYVAELEAIRDDAKQSLDEAQADINNIVDGYFTDFDGAPDTYADFDTGGAPATIPFNSGDLDLDIPPFDDSWLNSFDPYELLETSRYDSEFLEVLEQQCRSIFNGAIPGFTYSTAVSLFAWRTERDQEDLSLDLAEATIQFGTRRGFPIPPDAVAHKQNSIFRRHSDTQTDRTRETTALLAERLTDAVKHAMNVGVNVEDVRARMTAVVSEMLVAKIRAQVDVYQATITGLVAEFEGDIKLILAEADVAKANGLTNIQYQDMIVRKTLGLRSVKLGIINNEYRETEATNSLSAAAAGQVMKSWSEIYGSAALGVQTMATESSTI